jgi:hypothetical protein
MLPRQSRLRILPLLARSVHLRKTPVNPLAACHRPVCEIIKLARVPTEAIEDESALERALLLEISRLANSASARIALERVEARHAAGESVGLRAGASLFYRSDFPSLSDGCEAASH